ncbi:hypothetical protein B0H19DRAFT_1056145 [Mycena capillaripes]|nr:hypothetical protein B0H19DRAFT_1056145 [Mycena capillaripes]
MSDFLSSLFRAVSLFIFLTDCCGLPLTSVSECVHRRGPKSQLLTVFAESAQGVRVKLEDLLTDLSGTWCTPKTLIIAITAVAVGGLSICGIFATVLWYRRGNTAFLSTEEVDFPVSLDKAPLSARYIAPLPHVYAERLASVKGTSTLSTAQPSAPPPAKVPPTLSISVPTDEPPLGRWKLKRVPVPRLSRLPSPSLAKIRVALRTPRRQEFKGLPGSPRPKAKPKQAPSPLPINQDNYNRPRSPDLPSGFPSALPSAPPLTSRLATLMNRIQSEYNV